jgi:hypothetical protein
VYQYSTACIILSHLRIVVVLVILLLPYEIVHFTQAGRTYRHWRALLWSWERGPRHARLRLNGLLRLH